MKTYTLNFGRPDPIDHYEDVFNELHIAFYRNWQDEKIDELIEETSLAVCNMPKEVKGPAIRNLSGFIDMIEACRLDTSKVN